MRGKKVGKLEIEAIISDYVSGMSQKAVADKHARGKKTVGKIVREAGASRNYTILDCVICEWCGEKFEKFKRNKKQKFCSQQCANESIASKKNFLFICIVCNEQFISKAPNAKCCSEKCFVEHRKRRRKKNREKNAKEWICRYCGEIFIRSRKRNGFCSRSCASKFYIENGQSPTIQEIGVSCKKTSRSHLKLFKLIKQKFDFVNWDKEVPIYINENKRFFVDIICKNRNLIIEYFGNYWHANPEIYEDDFFNKKINMTAKDIRNRDKKRIETLKNLGYNVVVVWENDFNKNSNKLTKNLIDLLRENLL